MAIKNYRLLLIISRQESIKSKYGHECDMIQNVKNVKLNRKSIKCKVLS